MRLAIWNTPSAEFFLSGITSGAVSPDLEIVREPPRVCAALLEQAAVDVALVPTLSAARAPDTFDLLPAVALASWKYPFAQIVLRRGLGEPIRGVAFDPVYATEALVTRVVLREHYGSETTFKPYPAPSVTQLLDAPEDASLIVGNDVPFLQTDRLALDLGQEWYELSNYPMVWGLFAARKGEGTAAMVHTLRAAAEAADAQRGVWVQAQETSPVLHEFYRDDLRVRLDDLAVASLTEFCHQLFYIDILDEIPELPFITLAEEDSREKGTASEE
ncbi:MAG TPA: MqnA/MqnD/SBP family protein [Rhodothermales bacterium]|nr:MqnA/MqnD/SBP family protein [Rhodothermales bacterium]